MFEIAPPDAFYRVPGPGWFDSSFDLRRGLDVLEGWSDDPLAPSQPLPPSQPSPPPQPTARFTAAPRSSTAIA